MQYSKLAVTAGFVTVNAALSSPVIGSFFSISVPGSRCSNTAVSGRTTFAFSGSKKPVSVADSPRLTIGFPDDTVILNDGSIRGAYHGSKNRRTRSVDPGRKNIGESTSNVTATATMPIRKTAPVGAARKKFSFFVRCAVSLAKTSMSAFEPFPASECSLSSTSVESRSARLG